MRGNVSEPPKNILTLVSDVGTDRQDDAIEPAGPRLLVDVAVTRRQKTGALVAGKLALSGAHAQTVVCPILLPTLQGRTGPVLEDVLARVKEVSYTFPRRPQDTFPSCSVENGDDSPRPRTDPCLGVLSASKPSTGTEPSSGVTWKGVKLVVWLLRTHCVSPARSHRGRSVVSCGLGQGFYRATDKPQLAAAPGKTLGRSKYRNKAPKRRSPGVESDGTGATANTF